MTAHVRANGHGREHDPVGTHDGRDAKEEIALFVAGSDLLRRKSQ